MDQLDMWKNLHISLTATAVAYIPHISLLKADWSSFLPGVTCRPARCSASLVSEIIRHDAVPH
jgi:hypothetical protein